MSTSTTSNRVAKSLELRIAIAKKDASIPAPRQIDNGDEARYDDKSGTYTKGIRQKGIGLVDLDAYKKFKNALSTGDPADFAAITLGGIKTLNGPQGGLAFNLDCPDNVQFTKSPAPAVASEEYATELVEMYWASLLRDVPFTDYHNNQTAKDAAAELSSMRSYKGPRDHGVVTPKFLFRGGSADGKTFFGQNVGPYISQFLLQDTTMGGDAKEPSGLPIVQKYVTFKAGVDYMLDKDTFQNVQNGGPTELNQLDLPLRLHDGRGLAALTHKDILYQEFLMAYLLLNSLNVPSNPGNPYAPNNPDKTYSKTQNGFNTFGGPDIASKFAAVARQALNVVWYQKWYVHLRHRPESGGALVFLKKDPNPPNTAMAMPSSTVLNSNAVKTSFAKNKSFFLSQTFPEGSPTHPAYPTGHGTVAGACITVLKFFFNGDLPWPGDVWESSDGTEKDPCKMDNKGKFPAYKGDDKDKLTVNGELHKLAHNVTFGHGIHAGIHWRSDSDTSIQIGEEVALSYLNDWAQTYNEKFTVKLTKVDGSKTTISN